MASISHSNDCNCYGTFEFTFQTRYTNLETPSNEEMNRVSLICNSCVKKIKTRQSMLFGHRMRRKRFKTFGDNRQITEKER
uniref:Uncharacterized protein n=1 Tax=Arion vulgaris TaxID=1028688 RepID=A0A0B6ZTX3_9EUPU